MGEEGAAPASAIALISFDTEGNAILSILWNEAHHLIHCTVRQQPGVLAIFYSQFHPDLEPHPAEREGRKSPPFSEKESFSLTLL